MNDNLYWYAGLFEGEGCIFIRKQVNGLCSLGVKVSMTDKQIVSFFCERFGGDVKSEQPLGNRKERFSFIAHAQKALSFLHEIEPFIFSARVKEKISLAKEFQCQKKLGQPWDNGDYAQRQRDFHFRMKELNKRGFKG